MLFLKKEVIPTLKGIVYFKNEDGQIYATLNTHTNLYSYMKDFSEDIQGFFNDLANDTKEEEGVFIYFVKDELRKELDVFLASHFERTNYYAWAVGDEDEEIANNIEKKVPTNKANNKFNITLTKEEFTEIFECAEELREDPFTHSYKYTSEELDLEMKLDKLIKEAKNQSDTDELSIELSVDETKIILYGWYHQLDYEGVLEDIDYEIIRKIKKQLPKE